MLLLFLLCSTSLSHLLLTYGPPSDFQPSGFGIFNLGVRDFTGNGEVLGAQLVTKGRVTGVLAGSLVSVVYGSFNWVNGSTAYSLQVRLCDLCFLVLIGLATR